MNHKIWNRNKVNIDEAFTYNVAKDVISDIDDQEPMTIEDYRQRND